MRKEETASQPPLPGPEDSPIRQSTEEEANTPQLEEAVAESNEEATAPEEIIVLAQASEKDESQIDIPEQTS